MACWSPIPLRTDSQKLLGLPGTNVPCGKCIGCLEKRRSDWTFRIRQEQKVALYSTFLTLTYNDENVPNIQKVERDLRVVDNKVSVITRTYYDRGDNGKELSLVKKDLQNYFKRVRKEAPGLIYYAVGEYGSLKKRPHYHGIVFNVHPEILVDKWSIRGEKIGFVQCDEVTDASIHYVTKYIINNEPDFNRLKKFAVMSKGLGKIHLKYAEKFYKRAGSNKTTVEGGRVICLPRYYTEKIFTEEERKIIAERNTEEVSLYLSQKDYKSIMMERKAKKDVARKNSKSKDC